MMSEEMMSEEMMSEEMMSEEMMSEEMMSEEMNDGGGCLIATAAFGFEDLAIDTIPHVQYSLNSANRMIRVKLILDLLYLGHRPVS